jgi:hypothetical protein
MSRQPRVTSRFGDWCRNVTEQLLMAYCSANTQLLGTHSAAVLAALQPNQNVTRRIVHLKNSSRRAQTHRDHAR